MAEQEAARDIIVIGGSAGALGPLVQIAAALPAGFPASLFVVVHTSPDSHGLLPIIVGKSCSLNVQHAIDGEPFGPGHVYVAPPDRHLLLEEDKIKVVRGPRENRTRPAIDPLFRTAGRTFGPRVIAVLLSGVLNDGTYGLMAVKQHGGVVIVQDPQQAEYPDMPASAIEDAEVDHVLPAIEIANLLKELVSKPGTVEAELMHREPPADADRAQVPRAETLDDPPPGNLAPFSCPDCGGSLWETSAGKFVRYRCHVGHAFTSKVLLSGQRDELESALWCALRTVEETVELSQRLADQARAAGNPRTAQRHQEHANDMEQRAELLQKLLRSV